MDTITLQPVLSGLNGSITVPGDKSISHRAVMLGAIAEGTTVISNFLPGDDCLSTISCFQQLGVDIARSGSDVIIKGRGLDGLKEPEDVLYVGNSGTTIRLMLGILATRNFHAVVKGDSSISRRPMGRITSPLLQMGAKIDGRQDARYTPISIRGGELKAIQYHSPVASAQVKSSILLAGLGAKGKTIVNEPHISRDHTERMLSAFGIVVEQEGNSVSIEGGQNLKATSIDVPGDISSAAFFLAAAAITPASEVLIKNVGINPTRTGILEVLKQMGAEFEELNNRIINSEPVADLLIRSSNLTGIEIGGSIIPRLIDEIPIIALLATQAEGTTVIKDAAELKVKETNRIDAVVEQLRALGADISATDDGMIIRGKTPLKSAEVDSLHDHRIGMMNAIASCVATGPIILRNHQAINVSYPQFFEHFASLQK